MAHDLRPKSSTAHESVPLNSGDSEQESDFHLSQRVLKPFRNLRGSRFIQKTRFSLILRFIIFLLLEISFLAFSLFCLLKPIPLSLSNNETILRQAKAITTAISIVWHTLAAFAAQDLATRVFSGECMTQYCLTGKLKPGETDRVSTITSGLISRTKHFMSATATSQYRVGFVVAVILMALGPIGPAVLTVGSVPVESPVEIQLSKLTMNRTLFGGVDDPSADQASRRAELALRMETSENYTFGYDALDERVIIPWPQPELKSQGDVIIYMTDFLTYDFNCSWNAPPVNWTSGMINTRTMVLNGRIWVVPSSEYETRVHAPVFLGLFESGMITSLISDDTSSPESPTSGFLFIEPASGGKLTLENVPFTNGFPPGADALTLRGSVLLCDPRPQVHSGKVLLEKGTLRLYSSASELPSRIGNILDHTTDAMFSQALVSATAATILTSDGMLLSDHSISLFLDSQRAILPLEVINSNMNTYMKSAAKAYLGGLIFNSTAQLSRSWMADNATRVYQNPALVASKPFLIALAIIIAILAVLLSALIMAMPYDDIQLFDLHNFTIREQS